MLGHFCLLLNTFVLDPETQTVEKNANFNEAIQNFQILGWVKNKTKNGQKTVKWWWMKSIYYLTLVKFCHCGVQRYQTHNLSDFSLCMTFSNSTFHKTLLNYQSVNWLVVRAPDSWLKGRGFESLLERRENFLLQGQLSVLTPISVSVPPPCYRSST